MTAVDLIMILVVIIFILLIAAHFTLELLLNIDYMRSQKRIREREEILKDDGHGSPELRKLKKLKKTG